MTTEKDDDDFLFDFNATDVCRIDADFDVAVGHVRRLSTKLDQSGLLYLYARYKIVTDGPCNTAKPGFFDFRARQKWEAWKSLGNLNTDTAKSEYISYVNDNLGSFILDDDVTTNDDESSSSWKRKGRIGGLGLSISKFVFDDDADMKLDSDSPADCLLNAVKIDNVDLCKFYLGQDSNLLTEAIDQQRMTSLHWVADRCSMNVLQLFFEEFVEVAMKIIDAQDADGQTALHYASSCDHVDVVRLLLQHGANAALCDNDGNSPFDVAVSEEMKNLF